MLCLQESRAAVRLARQLWRSES